MSTRTCMKSAAARWSPSGRRGGGRRRGTRGRPDADGEREDVVFRCVSETVAPKEC